MRALALFLTVFLSIASAASAMTVLYSEDFSGQDDLGADGRDGTNTTGVSWTIDLGDAALFNSTDIFGVRDEAFLIRDTNVGCLTEDCVGAEQGQSLASKVLPVWMSPVLNVAGFQNLTIKFDYTTDGTFDETGGIGREDDFQFTASGGTSLDLLARSNYADNTGSEMVSILGPLNTLQFSFTGNTSQGSERLTFDNIVVIGEEIAPIPLPATLWLLGAALGGLLLHRRFA